MSTFFVLCLLTLLKVLDLYPGHFLVSTYNVYEIDRSGVLLCTVKGPVGVGSHPKTKSFLHLSMWVLRFCPVYPTCCIFLLFATFSSASLVRYYSFPHQHLPILLKQSRQSSSFCRCFNQYTFLPCSYGSHLLSHSFLHLNLYFNSNPLPIFLTKRTSHYHCEYHCCCHYYYYTKVCNHDPLNSRQTWWRGHFLLILEDDQRGPETVYTENEMSKIGHRKVTLFDVGTDIVVVVFLLLLLLLSLIMKVTWSVFRLVKYI